MVKGCNSIGHPKFLMVKVLALLGFKLKALIFMHYMGFPRIKVESLWVFLGKGRNFMHDTRLSRLKILI
jgi:hypothetical protein